MPVIYLRHPKHGTKVAVAEAEALYDEKSGWVRYTVPAPDSTPPDTIPAFLDELAPRRGRPRKDTSL